MEKGVGRSVRKGADNLTTALSSIILKNGQIIANLWIPEVFEAAKTLFPQNKLCSAFCDRCIKKITGYFCYKFFN